MLDNTRPIGNLIFLLSTIFTAVLLGLYVAERDKYILLTYSTPFSDWGAVRNLTKGELTWGNLSRVAWCATPASSPLCGCFHGYVTGPYRNKTSEERARSDEIYDGLLDSCMRGMPTWRKDTCGNFCRVHLVTPVLLACLATSLFLSRVAVFDSRFLTSAARYAPLILALCVIVLQLVLDLTGGILFSLAVVGMALEISYLTPCQDGATAFWAGARYVATVLAVWAAVTHQARDVYLVTAYGTLGVFVGTLAYYEHVIRCRLGSPTARMLGLLAWLGLCCVTGAFVLLIQQQWYPRSPVASSVASVVALLGLCAQTLCFYVQWVDDRVQMGAGLLFLTVCFVAATVDTVK